MFLIFGWRIWTILIASVSNHHFLFPDSISWEFSDLRCTSQGVFPPSAVQTLVPLSGNKWSVSWSCKPASHCYSLDVGCFRRVETLSIRMGSSLHFRVWIISYVFVDNGSHERGQTSRPVVGADLQTNCNFDAHIYHCRYSLDCYRCRYSMQRVSVLDSRIAPWFGRIVISCCLLISIASYAKIFCALRRHHAQIQSHVQQQPSQPNALNMARYRKAVYSALWVQLVLLACYVPVSLVGIVMAHIKGNSLHLVVALGIASTLVYFNSTLNPFLYCWKISEVRRAVKQTIRQALCCPRG